MDSSDSCLGSDGSASAPVPVRAGPGNAAAEPDLVGVGFVLNDLHRILHRFALEDGEIVGDEYAFTDEATESVGLDIKLHGERAYD